MSDLNRSQAFIPGRHHSPVRDRKQNTRHGGPAPLFAPEVCEVCGASVGVLASGVMARHRPGGGKVNLRFGDVPCMGGKA